YAWPGERPASQSRKRGASWCTASGHARTRSKPACARRSIMLGVTTTQASGPRIIAELIHGHGVSHVFFVPAILRDGLAELGRLGVTSVSAHGEKAAAYMADGYARALGRPGVCMSQTVGAANLAAGLKDAYLSCSPVIAFTGGTSPESRYRQVYQEIRDFEMFEPVTKWNAEVE